MTSYTVIGIVQCGIGGEWSESGLTATVKAETAAQARAQVLASQAAAIHEIAPSATVRWHSAELVRAIPQPDHSKPFAWGSDYHRFGEE